MLTVIKHDQRGAISQPGDQAPLGALCCASDPQGSRNRIQDESPVRDHRQVDEPGPAPIVGHELASCFHGEPCLATPGATYESHDPPPAHEHSNFSKLAVATDEAGEEDWQVHRSHLQLTAPGCRTHESLSCTRVKHERVRDHPHRERAWVRTATSFQSSYSCRAQT